MRYFREREMRTGKGRNEADEDRTEEIRELQTTKRRQSNEADEDETEKKRSKCQTDGKAERENGRGTRIEADEGSPAPHPDPPPRPSMPQLATPPSRLSICAPD